MPFFWKPYTSDVTDFIATLKERNPNLEAEQRAGRALLWDKAIDRNVQDGYKDARVPQRPYVYQTVNQTQIKPELQTQTLGEPPKPAVP